MLTLNKVKKNKKIHTFIERTDNYLTSLGFTDHGFRHVGIVAKRAREIAVNIGLSAREQELAAIAGYCHDMGNFLGRTNHHYWAALLFSQIYLDKDKYVEDVSLIMQAIVTHDKHEMKIVSNVAAVLILADKSDVNRNRVIGNNKKKRKEDIHDRVNYAVTQDKIFVSKNEKKITLQLKIDTKLIEPIEYFEIFTDRMTFCRQAAKYLKYDFDLIINDFKLT